MESTVEDGMRKDISVDMEDILRESTQNKQQEDFFFLMRIS